MSKRIAKNILLIGWGSAEWNIVEKLIENDELPNVKKLVDGGAHGLMASTDPPLYAAQWTTLVTGKIPTQHGVFTFVDAEDISQPVSPKSRKAKAIWDILTDQGLKTHQIGCWGTHPSNAINGVCISDQFILDVNERSVYPENQFDKYSKLKVSIDSVTIEQLKPFVSLIEQMDLENSSTKRKVNYIKSFIANSLSIYKATKQALKDNNDFDFLSTFFNDLSILQHQFMKFHVEPENDVDLKDVVIAAYKFLDSLLGDLLKMIDKETHVYLVSQSGFLDSKKWVDLKSSKEDCWEYNTNGLFIRYTESSKATFKKVYAMSLTDVVPTILVALGLQPAKDILGRVLLFTEKQPEGIIPVDTYEDGENAGLPTEMSPEFKQRLKDLGYVSSKTQNDYLKARLAIASNDFDGALKILGKLKKRKVENPWYSARIAGVYLNQNRTDELRALLDEILDSTRKEIIEVRMIKANFLIAEMKFRSASNELDIVKKNIGGMREVYGQIAHYYMQMNQPALAQKALRKELEIYETPATLLMLATNALNRKRFNLAIEPLERMLELLPNHPTAHFHLGTALMKTSQYKEAVEHFEKLMVLPNVADHIRKQANQQRIVIYREHLHDHARLKELKDAYIKSIGSKGDMIIVSGLPRSGTSMMMQMLVNAGLEPFSDGLRAADDNNKKGYFEHEAIKNLAQNNNVLHHVGDKVVKIISHLLGHLPHVYNYKIIFMDRPIEEVLTSQHKMLGRLDRAKALDESMRLKETFEKNRNDVRKWAKESPNVELIEVPYHEAIGDPLKYAREVKAFLKLDDADVNKMAAVVDPSLYRERADEINA